MTQKYSRNSKMLSGAFNITCVTVHRHSFSRCPRQHLTAEQSLQNKSTFPQVQHTADGALLSLLALLVLVLLLPASHAHTTGSFPPHSVARLPELQGQQQGDCSKGEAAADATGGLPPLLTSFRGRCCCTRGTHNSSPFGRKLSSSC